MPAKSTLDTPPPDGPAESGWFRFDGPQTQIYVDRALTVNPGDVIEWPGGAPADGHWTAVPAPTQEA